MDLCLLEARMMALIDERNRKINAAKLAIKRANREFDKEALPLARQINELRGDREVEAPAPQQRSAAKPVILDGLGEAERQHYLQLLEAKKG